MNPKQKVIFSTMYRIKGMIKQVDWAKLGSEGFDGSYLPSSFPPILIIMYYR